MKSGKKGIQALEYGEVEAVPVPPHPCIPAFQISVLLVAGFGALLGYFVWNTYANNSLIYSYPLTWGSAQWIAPQIDAPQGYFRKNLYISRRVNHAWIKVAAPDSYTLTVNGQAVAKKTFQAVNISGLYDITPYLNIGKNVIGVLVRRVTYPGTSKILVEGAFVDNLNQETQFVSDDSWKVKILEERQGNGVIVWTSPNFDDGSWPFAKIIGPADKERIYPLNVDYGTTEESIIPIEIPPTHPQLITNSPAGAWIWYPSPEVRTAYFLRSLDLPHRIREVWIRVAASQRYNLTVNGVQVANTAQSVSPTNFVNPARTRGLAASPATSTGLEGSSATSSKTGLTTGSLDLYNITPFIYRGSNSIGISVHGERSSQALLADGLVVYRDGGMFWFKSDSSWKTIPVADLGSQPSELQTSDWKPAVIVGNYPNQPWGVLNKTTKILTLPGNLRTLAWISVYSYILAGILIILLVWVLSAYLRSRLHSPTPPFPDSPTFSLSVSPRPCVPVSHFSQALVLDALAHLPSALFLGVCYLLRFDVRFDDSFPFQPWILVVAILILLGFKLAIMLEYGSMGVWKYGRSSRIPTLPHSHTPTPPLDVLTFKTLEENKKFYLACLLVVAVCGAWLRFHNLDYESINGDECGTLRDALSVLKRGYAFKSLGPYEKPLVTYELLPYPISLSFLLWGISDFTLRLPSALYGIFSIFLIFYAGSKLFNKRIGLFASAIFAFLPLSIHWAQNDRYPQPAHTLGLLISYLFYRSVNEERIKPRYIYPIALLYVWAYLTWEGMGFFLGALCLGLIVVRWKDYQWLKEPHLWVALIGIIMVVLVQGFRRKLYTAKYLVVGEGLLSGVTVSPVFVDPLYDPYYYLDNFFRAENHLMMSLLSVVGLPLFIIHPGLRYFATILVTVWFSFTNFFPLPTGRYLYHIQPYLIFLAVATCVYYGDYLISLGKGMDSQIKSYINTMILVVPLLVLFLATNPFILKLYRLSVSPNIPVVDTRYRTYQADQKTPNQYIRDHLRDGDYVIGSTPDVTKYYAGQADAFIESFTSLTVVYAEHNENIVLQDKTLGLPSLIGLGDLMEILTRYQRVWIAATPNSMFTKLNTPELISYVNKNFKVVYESYNARVYLWEK